MMQLQIGNPQVFRAPIDLPPTRDVDHAIELVLGAQPVHQHLYQYLYAQKIEIEMLVKDLLQAGIIQFSNSPFASPALLVQKDSSWQFCVDYRALNKITVPHRFPIPVVDKILDELHGMTIFSKLDLKLGYYQIRMMPENVPRTVFRTYKGHYGFLVMSLQ